MKYFLWINSAKQGPFDEGQIREMLDRGAVAPVSLSLADDGTDEWVETHLPSLIGPVKQAPQATKSYYILQKDESKGPFTIGQLRGMWNSGDITGQMMHCQEGDSSWRPLSAILNELEPPATAPQSLTAQRLIVVTARKNRGIYIILGLFLGPLGIHNFYAGYHGRGAAQLIITLVLGWFIIGFIITGIWALIEICSITDDGNGEAMT